jgi:hypothetical protein
MSHPALDEWRRWYAQVTGGGPPRDGAKEAAALIEALEPKLPPEIAHEIKCLVWAAVMADRAIQKPPGGITGQTVGAHVPNWGQALHEALHALWSKVRK